MPSKPPLPLAERIALGEKKLAEGRATGRDPQELDRWERALDDLREKHAAALAARERLALLHEAIALGTRKGYMDAALRTEREIIVALLRDLDPIRDSAEYQLALQTAGEAATLAALIEEYRNQLAVLQRLGEDILLPAAALELCLIHRETEGQTLPAPT